MLSSNFLLNVAAGYMEGTAERRKNEREVVLQEQKDRAKLDREFAGAVASAINSKNFRPESLPLLFKAYNKQYNPSEYAELTNLAGKVATTDKYGTYDLNLVQEYDYDTMSPFERSQIFWQSWDRQLSSEQEYQKALKYFKNDKSAMDLLQNQVRNNEYELRLGNQNRQTSAGRTGELSYINIGSQYGVAARLFNDLGFKNVSEEANRAIAESAIKIDPETEVAMLMNTRQTGGALTPVPVPVDKNTYNIWGEMAASIGYANQQQMLSDFSIDADFRKEDETVEQFAYRQNQLLHNAAKLHTEYGNFLANPANMDRATSEAFLARVKTLSNGNREDAIRMISVLTPNPVNVFKKTRQYDYAENSSRSIETITSNAKYIERITGLKPDDFNEGVKARREAVDYLDRLMELEGQISSEVGTGWVRSSARLLQQFGIQIQQGTTTLANLFGTNKDFGATKAGTTQSDLQAVILKVRPNINLNNISEAEAIRLTLAAKMARAVDPSGRLSNQDFEIQLRRLGDGAFTTYGEIITKLKTVRNEFAQDLQYKNRLKAVMDNQAALTPQVARTLEASMRLRNIESNIFGAKGRNAVVGSDSAATDTQQTQQQTQQQNQPQQLPPYGDTGFYGPDKDGRFYKDPQGTQPVDPKEFRRKTQQAT